MPASSRCAPTRHGPHDQPPQGLLTRSCRLRLRRAATPTQRSTPYPETPAAAPAPGTRCGSKPHYPAPATAPGRRRNHRLRHRTLPPPGPTGPIRARVSFPGPMSCRLTRSSPQVLVSMGSIVRRQRFRVPGDTSGGLRQHPGGIQRIRMSFQGKDDLAGPMNAQGAIAGPLLSLQPQVLLTLPNRTSCPDSG